MDPTRCVVVFDDDVRFIRLVERVLAGEGIRIEPITTDDLDDGLKIVAAHAPLAIVADIYMYDVARGFEFIERLKSEPATRSFPIIVASGADRELRRSATWLDDMGCAVLPKPFSADELVDCVLHAHLRPQPAQGNCVRATHRPSEPAGSPHALIRWLDRARHPKDGERCADRRDAFRA